MAPAAATHDGSSLLKSHARGRGRCGSRSQSRRHCSFRSPCSPLAAEVNKPTQAFQMTPASQLPLSHFCDDDADEEICFCSDDDAEADTDYFLAGLAWRLATASALLADEEEEAMDHVVNIVDELASSAMASVCLDVMPGKPAQAESIEDVSSIAEACVSEVVAPKAEGPQEPLSAPQSGDCSRNEVIMRTMPAPKKRIVIGAVKRAVSASSLQRRPSKASQISAAQTAIQMDIDDSGSEVDRESSIARGYEALGAELHCLDQPRRRVSSASLPGRALIQVRSSPDLKQLRCFHSQGRSAMELDFGPRPESRSRSMGGTGRGLSAGSSRSLPSLVPYSGKSPGLLPALVPACGKARRAGSSTVGMRPLPSRALF